MAVIQDRGPFAPQGGSLFAKVARIQASRSARPTRAAASNPLLNPGQPLSGKALLQAAQALTQAQTAGPLAELAKQIAAQNRQTAGTMKLAGGYYNQLGGQAQQGVTDEQGIASDLNAQLQRIAQGTNTQLQGIGQNATSSLLSHAPQGEGGLSTAALGSLTSEIARQQGLAAQQQGNQQAFGANQGANYSGLAATGLSSNALAGTQALRGIAQSGTVKNEPLLAKVADLTAQQGDLLAANEGKLRQQEINNAIARQGLGIKSDAITAENNRAQAALDAANSRSQASINAANARAKAQINAQNGRFDKQYQLDKQKFGAAGAKDAYMRRHGLGSYRPSAGSKLPPTTPTGTRTLPPVTQERLFGEVDTARTLIPQMQQPLSADAAKVLQTAGYNVQQGQKLSEGMIRHLLAVGPNPSHARYNPALVDAAYALAGYGYLTQKQIVELNKLGLIVGNRYKRGTAPQNVAQTVGGAAQGVGQAVGGVFK